MVQLSLSWLAIAVDVSVKSLLLAALAGLSIAVLRVRDTNVRHRVWTAVLAGMLAMPLLVLVTPTVPLPGWMTFSWQATLVDREVNASAPAANRDAYTRHVDTSSVAHDASLEEDATVFSDAGPARLDALENSAHFANLSPLTGTAAETADLESRSAEASVPESSPQAQRPRGPWLAIYWPVMLAAIYLIVFAGLFFRFLVGLLLSHRLVRQAKPVDPQTSAALEQSPARLLEHPQVYVPLTVGFFRPVILLPAEWRTWSGEKLQAVLAHELAHVRRGDWLVTLLAELNRAIYWFHPIAWFLKRRLAALAEQSCDDAVLEAHTDRAEYARYLLEVASSLAASG